MISQGQGERGCGSGAPVDFLSGFTTHQSYGDGWIYLNLRKFEWFILQRISIWPVWTQDTNPAIAPSSNKVRWLSFRLRRHLTSWEINFLLPFYILLLPGPSANLAVIIELEMH